MTINRPILCQIQVPTLNRFTFQLGTIHPSANFHHFGPLPPYHQQFFTIIHWQIWQIFDYNLSVFVSNWRWAFKRPFISPVGGRLKYFNQQPKLNPKARLSKVQKCFLIRLFLAVFFLCAATFVSNGKGAFKDLSRVPKRGAFSIWRVHCMQLSSLLCYGRACGVTRDATIFYQFEFPATH